MTAPLNSTRDLCTAECSHIKINMGLIEREILFLTVSYSLCQSCLVDSFCYKNVEVSVCDMLIAFH
jgi:hypothetical protein